MAERVMFDPGHGGSLQNGSSSAEGTCGPAGTLEKALTFDIAQKAGDELAARGIGASLTRSADQNPSLRTRVASCRAVGAEAFVSLHFNAASDPLSKGAEVWVHDRASARSLALGAALGRELLPFVGAPGEPVRGPDRAPLAVLDPASHAACTAACLVEIDYLTNPDVERRLGDAAYRAGIAAALARGIAHFLGAGGAREAVPSVAPRQRVQRSSESFDIWHQVPLVPQVTGMSCWAAAAAMIVGWRDCIDVRPEDVAQGASAWQEYRDGLEPSSVEALASTFGLQVETPQFYAVSAVRRLLERYGPLWVGAGPTGLHVVVVAGMRGDGSPDGTLVRVLDPWPMGLGARYTIAFRELAANLQEATDVAGVRASILHAGEVARGNRGRSLRVTRSYEAEARFGRGPPAAVTGPVYGTPLALFNLYRYDPPSRRAAPAVERSRQPLDDRDWYPATATDLGRPSNVMPLPSSQGHARTDDPDLCHLPETDRAPFSFSAADLGRLATLNGFVLGPRAPQLVLFGLRGCRLVDGSAEGTWSSRLQLVEDVPDHCAFRCLLGLWRPGSASIAVFTGSTVPSRRWMAARQRSGLSIANRLPTGAYAFRVGDHRFVPGVFVIQPRIAVRRSMDGRAFTLRDPYEEASPADNIHPAFTEPDAQFCSAGCQTVPGSYAAEAGHSGAWGRFRAAALAAAPASDGAFRYLLFTGREARLAASAPSAALTRLRFGSSGTHVAELQHALERLGLLRLSGVQLGTFDAPSVLAFAELQRQRDGGAADGIVRPTDARRLGVDLEPR